MGKKSITPLSMTGFGKGAAQSGDDSVTVEIRSVNSRYLDLSLKVPRGLSQEERSLREQVSEVISRGRVEVMVTLGAREKKGEVPAVNKKAFKSLLKEYHELLGKKASSDPHVAAQIALQVLQRKEVSGGAEEDIPVEVGSKTVAEATQKALESFLAMASAEGVRLVADLRTRGDRIKKYVKEISEIAKDAPSALKEKLLARIAKLSPEVTLDEQRLVSEVTFLADRVDITEECVRIESHLVELMKALSAPPHGRKLDFLLQEFGREFNTIGSKAQDAEIQKRVVEAKVELEKMREQVQNLV